MGPSILFLNHNLVGQATYFRNMNLARGLAARGWRPTVLTVAPERRWTMRKLEEAGVRVIETPWVLPSPYLAGNGCDPWDILRRCLWCAKHRFNITVVSDHLFNVSVPYFASRLLGRSPIYLADWADLFSRGGCHSAWNQGWKKPLHALSEKLEFGTKRTCDLAVAISRPLHRLLQSDCGKPADRTLFLPVGCNPELPFEHSVIPARTRLGMDPDGIVVGRTGRTGIAARLHDHEQEAFLAIHAFLKQQGAKPPVLYLVGDHQEAWYPKLREAGCQLRISGLLPSQEVPGHLRACDLFLLIEADTPFNRHRWPTRLTDYLVVGRPVLCNSVGDHSETLVAAGAGAVWDDLKTVPDPVREVLTSPSRRQTMSADARALAVGELSWPVLTARLEEFILRHYPALAPGLVQLPPE